MQDLNTQVLSVTGRTVGNGRTIYDIALGDGNKYSTFKPELANKAYGLVQQAVTARVEVKPSQDGRFTNYTLEDIAPQGQLPAMAFPAQPGMPAQAAPPVGTPQIPMEQSSGGGGRGMSEEDKSRISRFASQGTAFDFVATIYAGLGPEVLPDAIKYARKLTAELLSHGYTGHYDIPTPAQPPPETAADVASQVNEVAGDGAVQTGADVPWEN